MAHTTFEGLSADVKALIIDRIPRPSDLKNVCLVNKQLHQLAVKPLYRSVNLDLGSPHDNCLSAFLNPRNIGLQYIRRIRLYLAATAEKDGQLQQASLVTRMLLEFLPEDILEEFSWCPWRPFSADNLLLLYKKQRNMKWLEVMDLDRDILPDIKRDEKLKKKIFDHPRQLSLYPENRETLRLSEFFVQEMTDVLEDLVLHAQFFDGSRRIDSFRNSEHIDSRELNDSATGPGLLMSTIFSHMMPFDKCEPFQHLRSLQLDHISLRYCQDNLCRIVNFAEIEFLRIHSCPGADSLLGQLSRANSLPKKLRLLHFQHKDNAEHEALIALDGFLCLVSGIKDLAIDLYCVKSMPAAAGIARHGRTLEKLNVHCSSGSPLSSLGVVETHTDELTWDNDSFGKICDACTGLEQLSCAWPETSLIRAPSEEWISFEIHLEGLASLVTLHISNFPTNKPSSQPLPKVIYEQLLQRLAQRCFQEATEAVEAALLDREIDLQAANGNGEKQSELEPLQRHSKLRIIAFGISNKIYEREDSKFQLIYVRSSCKDAEGKSQVYAAPISWCLTQYVEPRSQVLSFILDRAVRAPWRDSVGSASGLGWNPDDDD